MEKKEEKHKRTDRQTDRQTVEWADRFAKKRVCWSFERIKNKRKDGQKMDESRLPERTVGGRMNGRRGGQKDGQKIDESRLPERSVGGRMDLGV